MCIPLNQPLSRRIQHLHPIQSATRNLEITFPRSFENNVNISNNLFHLPGRQPIHKKMFKNTDKLPINQQQEDKEFAVRNHISMKKLRYDKQSFIMNPSFETKTFTT